jgi:hypothetical protein
VPAFGFTLSVLKGGPEVTLRRYLLPCLRETYEDQAAAAEGTDLLIAVSELVFAALRNAVAILLFLRWRHRGASAPANASMAARLGVGHA